MKFLNLAILLSACITMSACSDDAAETEEKVSEVQLEYKNNLGYEFKVRDGKLYTIANGKEVYLKDVDLSEPYTYKDFSGTKVTFEDGQRYTTSKSGEKLPYSDKTQRAIDRIFKEQNEQAEKSLKEAEAAGVKSVF
jgi:hypothetical protein